MVTLPATVYSQQMVKKKLNVYYPAVHLTNPAVQHSINSKILQRTNELIRQQGYGENPDTEETGYYELKTNERNVLSLTLVNFAYSGGAHGLTVVVPLTFNVLTGKTYQLKDLFKKDSDYV
ncbi:MAG: DUF4163 domain-containing protein, partial [Priestia megaterium]